MAHKIFAIVLALLCGSLILGACTIWSPIPEAHLPPPPPPPPPPPERRFERVIFEGKAENPPETYWNIWAETSSHPNNGPIESVSCLNPNTEYLITLDLSAVSYAKDENGVYAEPSRREFERRLARWLKEKDRSLVLLKTVLVADPDFFISPNKIVEDFPINLEKVRKLRSDGEITIEGDPLVTLKEMKDVDLPDFVFGRVSFTITTRDQQGYAPIIFSFWTTRDRKNGELRGEVGRPVDEIAIEFFITSEANASDECGIRRIEPVFKGVDSVLIAAEEGPSPDAAIHVVELGPARPAIGIFHHKNQADGEYTVWQLKHKGGDLRQYLQTTQSQAFKMARNNEADLRALGVGLYNNIFPDTTPSGSRARAVFEDFVKPYMRIDYLKGGPCSNDLPFVTNDPPVLFLRVIQQGNDRPLLIPLGLMAVKSNQNELGEFLGLHFRIETPLTIQTYQSSSTCLSRWVMLFPPAITNSWDPLQDARKQIAAHIKIWQEEATSFDPDIIPFDNIREFKKWINKNNKSAPEPPTALIIMSHHGSNILSFEDGNVTSGEVEHWFEPPSLVILNGCGTEAPGAEGFIDEFNSRGIHTIIATSTEVDARMAGAFMDCLVKILDQYKDDIKFTISRAYFRILQCLRCRAPKENAVAYGLNVLKYSLLGNGNIRLCSPAKQL